MATAILATKLYIPPPRPKVVHRPHLIERLNEGLHHKLTLISAPVGYGKTTLVSEWAAGCERGEPKVRVAWLSLDEGDNDPTRFLTYLVAALQTLAPSEAEGIAARRSPAGNIGAGVMGVLQSPQPPPIESILTILLNEITTILINFILVLDDYHVIDAAAVDASTSVDDALTFLLEHMPPHMHLVIATHVDPQLPLARLRARGQLTELRAADLRFTTAEAAEFLNQVMSLNLSAEDIATLENRTEGWIAGLQLAALSTRGREDVHGFISAFTGDNQYIVDYLIKEVLQRQSERVRSFLLQTSILEWLSVPLCDAVTGQEESSVMLETLERGNLFVSRLGDKRLWFRYHRLFADVLHTHLMEEQPDRVPILHRRASEWYEHNGLEIEAFQHAAAANDVERAERLMEGKGMPLQYRGAMTPVLHWLESLPTEVLDARPSLCVAYASVLTMAGKQISCTEEILQAAEAALLAHNQNAEPDDRTRDLIGYIAAIRATFAVLQNQVETIIAQSRRALEFLHLDNLAVRTTTTWTLGYAYQLQGDRAAATRAYTEAISISQASGNIIVDISATTGLGQVQEAENQLDLAVESYRRVLQLVGDPPWLAACEAYLGLARICYQRNDLEAALQHGQHSLQLALQIENVGRSAACEVLLARLKLAQGDVVGAAALLAKAEQFVRRNNFVYWLPDIAAAQVLVLLHQGNLAAAAHLAQTNDLPLSQARVHLAQEDPSTALVMLGPLRQQVEAKGWKDEQLKVMILAAIAHHALDQDEQAVQALGDALALAEPGGLIRIFVDEGQPMACLLNEILHRGIAPNYVQRILAAFPIAKTESASSRARASQSQAPDAALNEPLSQREMDVLQLIAQGLSNREISKRLSLALDTVKGHNRKIFGKLHVQRRTEAVARARELGLL